MRKFLIAALFALAVSPAAADTAVTLYDASTTNYTQIKAPPSLGGTYRMLMPVQNGTTSQVLMVKSVAGNVIQTTWSNVSSGGGGSANWGAIGGTLSNQTDLQNALNAIATSTATITTRVVQVGLDTATLRTQLVTGFSNVATSTAALQTQISATGVSTGSLQSQINNIYTSSTTLTNGLLAVGLTTATLKTRIDNLDSSTATITTRLVQVGVDTATLKTRVDNLDASTATITTRLTQVGLDTATLRTSLNTVASATTTLSQNFPVSLSTNVVGILPVANGGTNTASPNLVAGTNITSITGTWPNQTINAATQSSGGGGAPVAFTTGTPTTYSNPAVSSPLIVGVLLQTQFGITATNTTGFINISPAMATIATSTGALQTQITATALATGTINSTMVTNFANVATSTAALQTQITATGVSTGSLQGQINNVYTSSANITTRLNNLDTSTNTLAQNFPVSLSTNTMGSLDLSTSKASGILSAGRFPALTGDVTTSAGALATTAATTQGNIKAFSSPITFVGSVTVNSSLGSGFPWGINVGTMTGANLTTCGDTGHALGYSATTGLFSCQAITGGSGASLSSTNTWTAGQVFQSYTNLVGSTTITVSTLTANGVYFDMTQSTMTISSFTAANIVDSGLTASLPVQTNASKLLTSAAIDLSGAQATGALAAARFPALTGDVTTSAGNLATTAAAAQTHITSVSPSGTLTLGSQGNAVSVSSNAILPGATFYQGGPVTVTSLRLPNISTGTPMSLDVNGIFVSSSDINEWIFTTAGQSQWNVPAWTRFMRVRACGSGGGGAGGEGQASGAIRAGASAGGGAACDDRIFDTRSYGATSYLIRIASAGVAGAAGSTSLGGAGAQGMPTSMFILGGTTVSYAFGGGGGLSIASSGTAGGGGGGSCGPAGNSTNITATVGGCPSLTANVGYGHGGGGGLMAGIGLPGDWGGGAGGGGSQVAAGSAGGVSEYGGGGGGGSGGCTTANACGAGGAGGATNFGLNGIFTGGSGGGGAAGTSGATCTNASNGTAGTENFGGFGGGAGGSDTNSAGCTGGAGGICGGGGGAGGAGTSAGGAGGAGGIGCVYIWAW